MILEAKFEENAALFEADFSENDTALSAYFGEAAADVQKSYNNGYENGLTDGKQAEYDAFWDNYQQNGHRTNYRMAFASEWNTDIFKPKYNMYPTLCAQMFAYSKLGDIEQLLLDAGVVLNTYKATTFTQMFAGSSYIYTVPEIDIRKSTYANGHMYQMFTGSQNIHTIRKLIFREDGGTTFTANDFNSVTSLQNLEIAGVIGKNGFSVTSCSKLTHNSLISIINALQDKTADTSSTVWKVTLGSTNKAKLTNEELTIAYKKGWQVV